MSPGEAGIGSGEERGTVQGGGIGPTLMGSVVAGKNQTRMCPVLKK